MRKSTGFTLIELLVVIAIIGVLSTLAVVALGSARQKARDVKRTNDVKEIQTALELYNNDRDGYPLAASPIVLGTGNQRALCTGGFKAACDPADVVYMGIVPTSPTPTDGTCTAGENDYSYTAAGGANFVITFCIGADVGNLPEGVHTASPNGIE